MTGKTVGQIEEARLERAIEYVRHGCLNGMPLTVAMPDRKTALGYAMVATAAVYDAAKNSSMPWPDSIERTIEVVREWYSAVGKDHATLDSCIADLNDFIHEMAPPDDIALEYVHVAAVALRLSVQAGDFV